MKRNFEEFADVKMWKEKIYGRNGKEPKNLRKMGKKPTKCMESVLP